MADPLPVRAAKGNLATFEEFAQRERDRLASGGPYPVSEGHSRTMLAHYEEKADEWGKALKRVVAEEEERARQERSG